MGHLWLIGMMGSGKTTVGAIVAEHLGVPFYDTDDLIEMETGRTIGRIFHEDGEAAFREVESRAVEEVASADSGVVATGGGVVLDQRNVEVMKASGTTVLIDVGPELLSARLDDASTRPLLDDEDGTRLGDIANERAGRYRDAADVVISGEGPVDEIASEVEGLWHRS
jgi:shikimate kinase